jgi:hypothetical protein
MRTFVSTNVLPLMPFVPARPNHATQMKALFEQFPRLSLGTFVSLFLPHERLDFLSDKAADGRLTPGGKNPSFSEHLTVETERYVLFAISRSSHNVSSYHVYHV